MKLPNPERATVDIKKLREYCLNPEHRHGWIVRRGEDFPRLTSCYVL